MILGFTGTRDGMTEAQRYTVRYWLSVRADVLTVHHGDCVGADEMFDSMARDCGALIHVHPANTANRLRAGCARAGDSVYPAKAPLARNRDIVDACGLLIACPRSATEEIRSGTWATIRYARRLERPILIVMPDGSVKKERF